MNRQEIWFVINPLSGKVKNHQKVAGLIESRLDKKRYSYKIIKTLAAGHATEIAYNAAEKRIPYIVAIGGDGTMNETAKALVGSETALGIIPMGSGNGLARELGIALSPLKVVEEAINSPQIRQIDTCYVNSIPFFCTAGLGFDAQCAMAFSKLKGRGFINYARAGFQEFWKYKPVACNFNGNNYEVFSLTFGNARQFGNNAYIAPLARLDDGFVDCTLLAPVPLWGVPGLVSRLFNKTIHESAYAEIYRSRNFKLKGQDKWLIHYDGEPIRLDTDELTISIKEKSLRVMI